MATTVQVPITKSAYVDRSNPNSNYGTGLTLLCGKQYPQDIIYNRHLIYISWALPSYMKRKRITAAKFKFYNKVTYPKTQNTFEIQYFAENWNESTLTYNNRPQYASSDSFLATNIGLNKYIDINIPEDRIDIAINDNLYGLMFSNYRNGADNDYLEFDSSRAASNKPYLEVTYEDIAPQPPTNLSPSSEVKMQDSIIRFSWLFKTEAQEDSQSKFDLQWSSNGGQTWNTITQTTTNQYYDMPTNTLPVGSIVWRVRTYNLDGLASEYSEQAAITIAGKPDTPTLTRPNTTENTSKPLISWTASGQVMYQAQVLQGTNIVWDSGEVASTAGQVQVGVNLADNTSYTAKVRIKNQYDLWSDWASKAFTVDFELPNKPTFDIVKDLVRASIRLTVTNPTPDGTGGFSYNEVYRRKVNGSWVKIASNIARNGTYEDCAMASSQPYEYMVRTIGTYGYMDSDIKYADIRVRNSQLASISDKNIYVPLVYDPKRNLSLGMGRTLMQFAGREKPVSEFGESKDFGIALSFVIKDIEDLDTLMALIESAETLLYRDNRGRKIYCTIGGLSIDEERKYWTVSFAIAEVSHQEGV